MKLCLTSLLKICIFVNLSQSFMPPSRAPAHRSRHLLMSYEAVTKNREITVKAVEEMAGSYMSLVEVKHFSNVSTHKILMGKQALVQMSERLGKSISVDLFFKSVIVFMLSKNMPLENTEGMIDPSVFPVNYFTVSQLEYFHPDVWEKLDDMIINEATA